MIVISCALLCGVCKAQESDADEYEVRAAMLFNMTKFVDFPGWKTGDSASPFQVCFLGIDPSTTAIESLLKGKSVDTKPVVTHRLGKTDDGAGCHILYVAKTERKRFAELMPSLTKASVLTVGEADWLTTSGGVVGLPLVDSRVRIEINLGSAQRSSINVSSKLLRLATVVR